MINALRVLAATALLAGSVTLAQAQQKSLSKSIEDGWESVVKDASKAAKKAAKAADTALTPKKPKRRKSAKHKDDEDKQPPAAETAKTSVPDDDGPPVPLTRPSEPSPAKTPQTATVPRPQPAVAPQPSPAKAPTAPTEARRLPPPPKTQNAKTGPAKAGDAWSATSIDDPTDGKAGAKSAIRPTDPEPAGKAIAPAGKPLPITMIPPKTTEPASPPATWSKEEIETAKTSCAAILKSVEAVTIPEAPIREGNCGAPAPVRLVSIGKNPEVALSPPALVTCDLVAGLYQWMKSDVQPLAKKHFGAAIIKIETMSDYSCRMAYGRKGNKLSEHGKANALDIRGFVTAKGETAYVLEQWGKTDRDRKAEIAALAAQKAAAEKVKEAAAAGGAKSAIEGDDATLDAELPSAKARVTTQASLTAAPKIPERKSAAEVAAAVIVPDAPRNTKSQFLHDVHDSACRIFGTSLGPESNEAHRNHFHVDMAERKRTKICE